MNALTTGNPAIGVMKFFTSMYHGKKEDVLQIMQIVQIVAALLEQYKTHST